MFCSPVAYVIDIHIICGVGQGEKNLICVDVRMLTVISCVLLKVWNQICSACLPKVSLKQEVQTSTVKHAPSAQNCIFCCPVILLTVNAELEAVS